MTRNSEINLEDITGCDHKAETAISNDQGEITGWVCRCGDYKVGVPQPMGGITVRKEMKEIPILRGTEMRLERWISFHCDCCKWPYVKPDNGTLICVSCEAHDLTKPCELICDTCGEPSHKHPVTRPGLHCTHGGIAIVNPKLLARLKLT